MQNSGNKARGISVVVSSATATQVFSSDDNIREVFLQNTSEAYNVHCGTFSTVTATVGVKRWILPKFPVGYTNNGTYSIYCIAESSAGGTTIEIVGSAEYDSKDITQ